MPSGKNQKITHPFPPLYDENSEILILGSFPSVKSREQKFFYGHPQNRFWKVLAAVLGEPVPQTIPEKQDMLHRNHIALWDVIYECEIIGSSDSSIKNAVPTDLTAIISSSKITHVYCNGKTSFHMYECYQETRTGLPAQVLPSTSPANAAWTLDKLTAEWKKQLEENVKCCSGKIPMENGICVKEALIDRLPEKRKETDRNE